MNITTALRTLYNLIFCNQYLILFCRMCVITHHSFLFGFYNILHKIPFVFHYKPGTKKENAFGYFEVCKLLDILAVL